MSTNNVDLYIYDLSRGLAANLGHLLLGKPIDGVWHTSIIVYGREYFFGSHGISSCNPGTTSLGAPLRKLRLGDTQVPYSVFIEYVNGLGESTWAGHTYSLWEHNCNNFSEEIAQFLCGVSIPKYILDLPNEVRNSAFCATLPALISQLEKSAIPIADQQGEHRHREDSPEFDQLNSEIAEVRYKSLLLEERRKTIKEKLAKKDRKKEKKRKKLLSQAGPVPVEYDQEASMADAEVNAEVNGSESRLPLEQALDLEEEERREDEEKKKAREPPIVYKDLLDANNEFDALLNLVDGKLTPDEQKFMEELQVYLIGNEGSWALSDGFLSFIGRLLHDKSLPDEIRVRTINILAIAALKDDIILVLHQDRKDHVLMNYAFEIDRNSKDEQEALALFFANMFENLNSSEWLMYISEWTVNNQPTSNIRVTTKVAVHCLLSDVPLLQERGTAIIHNLACKEVKSVVFDDVAVELTMALLQYFNSKPGEEELFRSIKALARFIQISSQEVPQLIQMIGPDPRSFKGTSPRIDAILDQIGAKLR